MDEALAGLADLQALQDTWTWRMIDEDRATPEEIEMARALWVIEGNDEIAIDDDARVSKDPQESGYWIQAWVWVGE